MHTHTHMHTGNSIYLTEHTSHVLAILRKHLLHHEFDDAAVTMETLSISADRVLEITRKVKLLYFKPKYGVSVEHNG